MLRSQNAVQSLKHAVQSLEPYRLHNTDTCSLFLGNLLSGSLSPVWLGVLPVYGFELGYLTQVLCKHKLVIHYAKGNISGCLLNKGVKNLFQ